MRYLVLVAVVVAGCRPPQPPPAQPPPAPTFTVRVAPVGDALSVFRAGYLEPVVTQSAGARERPYLHPVRAPDGKGVVTQLRPSHHPHQTGIYWGPKRLNDRDFFMNWGEGHWRRVAVRVLDGAGERVSWQTTYELLDADGKPALVETQTWALSLDGNSYALDLEWRGTAQTDITFGKFYVGGLFVRMPWHEGIDGQVVNAAGQRNTDGEGQRAIWTDIGMRIDGRADQAHIAILDHPDNAAFPTPWRVDSQLGVGPSRQILGDWTLPGGNTETIRYRLLVYTGRTDEAAIERAWRAYVCACGDQRSSAAR